MKKKILCLLLAFLLAAGILPVSIFKTREVYAESNEMIIFRFLKENVGLNTAAACGVLANIEKESGFRHDILEYGYTWETGGGYGICQWTNSPRTNPDGRRTKLVNWCTNNGYDYRTLIGQLNYLKYELNTSYYKKWVTSKLLAVPNTADGAYEAGRVWCYYYEVPAGYKTVSVTRGNAARDKYWPKYSGMDALDLGTGFYAYIKNMDNNMLVTADGTGNGSNICMRAETGQQNQIWYFARQSDGSYAIKSAKNESMCMDVSGYGTTNGTNVHLWSYNGNTAQKWYLSGTQVRCSFRAQCAQTVLDVYGSSNAEGTNLQMWASNSSRAQHFAVIKLNSGKARYYLDVNGLLNGQENGTLGNFGTFDVWINGKLYKDNVTDFYERLPEGTTYQLSDLKAKSGFGYNGIAEGSISGTIRENTFVRLKYDNMYKININGAVDGKAVNSLKGILTFDVAIDGNIRHGYAYEYKATNPYNSSYEILNFRMADGYELNEEGCINLMGRLTSDATVFLDIRTALPKFTFDPNGGTGGPKQQEIRDVINFLPTGVPTREGYEFLGWATVSENPTQIFSPGDIYFTEKSVKLYAIWEKITVEEISISSLPSKTEYEPGEDFDPTGLELKVTLSDGSEKIIDEGFTVTGFDSDKVGNKVITVTYEGESISFGITVRPEYLKGDVNEDGKINAIDATQILRFANSKNSVIDGYDNKKAMGLCDVNEDRKINAVDATQILRFANSKPSVLKK
ncbi:MAG: RICIN domain-containing protein [Eubacteriaceae bacterium]|nr:RICIN domain-containing protein [Eubacteriaceae bacterium]